MELKLKRKELKMIKQIKEDPILIIPIFVLFIFITAFVMVILLAVDDFKSKKLTEQDYFNKFCTKYYDVSCDNIKIK